MNGLQVSKKFSLPSLFVFIKSHALRSPALLTLLAFVLLSTVVKASEFEITGPVGSTAFGTQVIVLPNGNIVVTDPNFAEAGKTNIGAVYLFDGATLALISTLKGNTTDDRLGLGAITVLPNSNFVVTNGGTDNGAAVDAGSVTFCDGTTGCDGVVSPTNSLVGSTSADSLGLLIVTVLPNGNYLVNMTDWDRPSPLASNVGAVTLCSGTVGCVGTISASNSLIGAQTGDRVGLGTGINITVLADGDYVVNSRTRRISTFCSGTSGCVGAVSSLNSLFGVDDAISLTNGNYVVPAPLYFGPDANSSNPNPYGAVAFCDGTTGCIGTVNSNPSLRGSAHAQSVGVGGIVPLPNGNYVVSSPRWDNPSPAIADVGAVTWCSGTSGCNGFVDVTNSLIGSTATDLVGRASDAGSPFSINSVAALTDGNYVVASSNWDNGALTNVGAVTWCSGATGCVGHVAPSNSLIGSSANDRAGDFGNRLSVFPLKNGNYVVNTPFWNQPSPAIADVGAATFCNGAANSCAGQAISAANSLVGSRASDLVGSRGTTSAAGCGGSNGYVVSSPNWDNGVLTDAGAATFCDGGAGCTGAVSTSNSFVGSKASDQVGGGGATALPNGSFVILSSGWDNGALANVGAVTFCNGVDCVGPLNSTNSLIGASSGDQIGNGNANLGPLVLNSGNYVVHSPNWDNGANADAGAVTLCSGAGGCTGAVSSSNSLVGSHPSDQIGTSNFVKPALANGNYIVPSPLWDNGAIANAGAITFASGVSGVTGPISAVDSVIGTITNAGPSMFPSFDQVRNRLFVGRGANNAVSVVHFESTAVADGNLSDPATWSGSVPNSLSNVAIPTGRTVTVDTPSTIGNLSIASGASFVMNADVKLAGNLDLGAQIDTGENKLTLSCPSRIVGASGSNYIIGNLEKIFCATDPFLFATGTASGYSPVNVTPTAACSGSSSLTVRANEGIRTGMNANQSVNRFWTLAETGSLTADLVFTYPDADVRGDETTYGLYKWEGTTSALIPSVANVVANTVATSGISEFSDWAIGNIGSSQLPQTISFNTIDNRSYGDADFTLTATASSGLPVTYAASGSCTVVGNIVHLTGAGSCTITATQPGNGGYEPAPDVQQTFTIAKADYSIAWSSPASITYGTLLDGTQLNAVVSGVPNGAPIGSVAYSPLPGTVPPAGSQTLTVIIAETSDYNAASYSVPLTVTRAVLNVDADDQTKQYSDPLPAFTYAVSGFVNGDTIAVVNGAAAASTTANQFSGPGDYPIDLATGTLNADNYTFELHSATLTVEQEDARVSYTGPLFVNTACATCSTATVTLAATIKDITAAVGDPAYDPDAGDIRNATATFINRDTNTPIATVPVNLVSAGDATIGIAMFDWNVNIGSADSADLTIGVVVGNYYVADSSADDVVVTVSKPISPGFVTGGGYLVLSNSVGQYEGGPGTKVNFGFNVKNVKKNLQGRLNVIARSGGRVYQFKGNVMSTLGVNLANPDAKTAIFTGKANLTDTTDPHNPIALGGNNLFRVELTDRGEPGQGDSIAITFWDSGGLLLFSSNWNGSRTIEQILEGGNLVVR